MLWFLTDWLNRFHSFKWKSAKVFTPMKRVNVRWIWRPISSWWHLQWKVWWHKWVIVSYKKSWWFIHRSRTLQITAPGLFYLCFSFNDVSISICCREKNGKIFGFYLTAAILGCVRVPAGSEHRSQSTDPILLWLSMLHLTWNSAMPSVWYNILSCFLPWTAA